MSWLPPTSEPLGE